MALPLTPTMMATTPLLFLEPALKLNMSAPRPPRQLFGKAKPESCLRHNYLAAPLSLQLKPSTTSTGHPSFDKALERMRKRGLQEQKETQAESTPTKAEVPKVEMKKPTSTKEIQDTDPTAKEAMARKARRRRTQ